MFQPQNIELYIHVFNLLISWTIVLVSCNYLYCTLVAAAAEEEAVVVGNLRESWNMRKEKKKQRPQNYVEEKSIES